MGFVDNSYPAGKIKPYQDFMVRITVSVTKPSSSENDATPEPVKLVTCFSAYQRSASDALSEAMTFMGEGKDFLVQAYPIRLASDLHTPPVTTCGNVMWRGEFVGGVSSQTHSSVTAEVQVPLLSFSSRLTQVRDYMHNWLRRLIDKNNRHYKGA